MCVIGGNPDVFEESAVSSAALTLYMRQESSYFEAFVRFIFSVPAVLKMISKSSFTSVNSGFSIIFALLEQKLSFVQRSHFIA